MLISSRWSDSIPKFSHRDFNNILDCHTAGLSRYFDTSIADDSDSKLAAQLETHGRHKMALLHVVFHAFRSSRLFDIRGGSNSFGRSTMRNENWQREPER
jgi:hypothetical protein